MAETGVKASACYDAGRNSAARTPATNGMAVNSQHELMLALERAQYGAILETPESDYLDFKEAPYQLLQPHQKWELAKDVAGFGNSRGGLIVVGYRTRRPANALVEQAVEHRPVHKPLVNWDAIQQVLGSWIYPPIEGVTPFWFPAAATINTGVLVISVPPQPDAAKYFVVRELDRPDGRFPGAVGIPIRQGDAVTWLRPEAVHHLVREGLTARQAGRALATAVDQALAQQGQLRRVEGRCQQLEARAEWAEVPFIALHAIPGEPAQRPDDFYSREGLMGALEHPDVLREHGFHIRTEVDPEVQADGALAVVSGRRALWLSPDGFFSAAGRADAEFFGWHVNAGAERPLALNPRVLTEFTLEFARFFHARVRPLSTGVWWLGLSLVGMDRDGDVVLVPAIGAGGQSIQFWRGRPWVRRPALQPTTHRRVESVGEPGRDAHRLLVELYACFGLPPDEIPFVQDGSVSESLLLEGMGR